MKEEAEEETGPAAEADKSQHRDDCQDNYLGQIKIDRTGKTKTDKVRAKSKGKVMSPLLKKTLLQCYLVPVPTVYCYYEEKENHQRRLQAFGQEGESNEWQ